MGLCAGPIQFIRACLLPLISDNLNLAENELQTGRAEDKFCFVMPDLKTTLVFLNLTLRAW